jgi:hypothetical protein
VAFRPRASGGEWEWRRQKSKGESEAGGRQERVKQTALAGDVVSEASGLPRQAGPARSPIISLQVAASALACTPE